MSFRGSCSRPVVLMFTRKGASDPKLERMVQGAGQVAPCVHGGSGIGGGLAAVRGDLLRDGLSHLHDVLPSLGGCP